MCRRGLIREWPRGSLRPNRTWILRIERSIRGLWVARASITRCPATLSGLLSRPVAERRPIAVTLAVELAKNLRRGTSLSFDLLDLISVLRFTT